MAFEKTASETMSSENLSDFSISGSEYVNETDEGTSSDSLPVQKGKKYEVGVLCKYIIYLFRQKTRTQ